ncbi:MAG: hypothetical protein HeimC2_01840 [Candidatus Heimdallarchaeota archaeon LC_2]|nr:MAG: hypothetical protein HeimC2_01840 [Candidatus Heimdallarchaeota archaeon LC_2]
MNKFVISSVSITRTQTEDIESFTQRILTELNKVPSESLLVVLPEYCWGNSSLSEVNNSILQIRNEYKMNFIFGTFAFDNGFGNITNNAIIAFHDKKITYSAKTVPMMGEQMRQQVKAGNNIGVVDLNKLKIGILICADLWNWKLVHRLVVEEGAQMLIIPAFTVVPRGLHQYAKYQWLSLAITRSREFVVPILISDHLEGTQEYDVGGVSCIIDPSFKDSSISSIEDFVNVSTNKSVSFEINLKPILEYRNYRKENGLLQK